MRSKSFGDALYDDTDWQDWIEAGAPDAGERTKDIVREILAEDSESLVDEELLK